jgi:hypothetical protein
MAESAARNSLHLRATSCAWAAWWQQCRKLNLDMNGYVFRKKHGKRWHQCQSSRCDGEFQLSPGLMDPADLLCSKPLAVLFWLMCAVLALVDGAGKTLRRARSTQVCRLCSLHSFVQPVISGQHVLQPQPLTSQMNCRLFCQAQTPRMMIRCRSIPTQ